MNMMMLFAATGSKQQQTVTFSSNQTWVAPAGITLLNSVIGKGSDSTTTATFATVVIMTYHSTGSAGSGSIAWDNVQGFAEAAAADLDNGSATWTRYTIQAYPDGTNTLATSSVTVSTAVNGTSYAEFTGGWDTSGPVEASGTSRVAYTRYTNGTASTGFSKTFPGGASGALAPITSFTNVAITPGASYSIVVPTGGTVQITYFN